MGIMHILLIIGVLFGFYMLYRNELVFRVRMRISQEIHEINTKQIRLQKQVDESLYEVFEKYSYNKMMYQLLKFSWTLEEIRRG